MHLTDAERLIGKLCDGMKLGRSVVEGWDHRNTDNDVRTGFGKCADIVMDLLVWLGREFPVLCGIHVLDVHKERIDQRDEGCNGFPVGTKCGFDRRVDAVFAAGLQQCAGKFRLVQ